MHRLRIFLVPLPAGCALYAAHQVSLSSSWAVGLFCLLWAVDIFTLTLQARLAYSQGLLSWAWWCYAARLFFSWKSRARWAAEIAWILQDLGQDAHAALWLSRLGQGSQERDPCYAASLARYMSAVQANPDLAMDLADESLERGNSPRAHYVRGLCYLAASNPHLAIAAFDAARTQAAAAGDTVLTGFCYLGLGEAWTRIGEREYARDHLLRAEIMLSFLPDALQKAKSLLVQVEPPGTDSAGIAHANRVLYKRA